MITSLQNLPEVFKEDKNKKLAKWVVKYQKFSTKAALKYAPEGYSEPSKRSYFENGLSYMNTGKRVSTNVGFYNAIDECIKEYVQPLTPCASEKRRVIKKDYTKAENIPPVAKLKMVQKPLTAKIIYGVQFDDTIKIFESEEVAHGFNKGLEYAGKETGKVVTVELGEV